MPFSAACGATKDNLNIGMFLNSSDLLLLRRTSSFALYFLGKSHVEVSLAVCFWLSKLPLVPYHPEEYSISFVVVFVLPIFFLQES